STDRKWRVHPAAGISFQRTSNNSDGKPTKIALTPAVNIPNTYSAIPASQRRPPLARHAIKESATSNVIPARKFNVSESRHAKAAAARITSSNSQWPPSNRTQRRQRRSKTISAPTTPPIHNRTFNPQGVARNNPSPSTPSSSAASNTLIPCFVLSLISRHQRFLHSSIKTQAETLSSCARGCSHAR